MEDMARRLPRYVTVTKTKYKKVLLYFRVDKGPRTRLPDDPNSEEFKEAYRACLIGEPVQKKKIVGVPTTTRWLVERYMESAAWRNDLSDATRRQRSNILKHVVAESGDTPFAIVQARHIRNRMEKMSDTPAQANNYLKTMVGLFSWAVKNDHVKVNPTIDVDRLKAKTKGFPEWTQEDGEAFRARWPIGTAQRLAFELLLHSGLRRGDVVTLGRQHLKGNILSITTQKTGTTITVELPDAVLSIIAATKTGDLHFLVTSFGKPFSVPGFGNWFHAASVKAGVHKNAHGIRKLAATTAANDGATSSELMAQFGWTTSQQADVYTKGADRVRLGISASRRIARRLEAQDAAEKALGGEENSLKDSKGR